MHGGATINTGYYMQDQEISLRKEQNQSKKERIVTYAVQLIKPTDFVYIDAGTTTELLVRKLVNCSATFVTNACEHAQILSENGCTVHILGGKYKYLSEATVGLETISSLLKYHFSVGFFGTNGVSIGSGFTTPEIDEDMVKETSIQQCRRPYILSGSEKFDIISTVNFCTFEKATVITTSLKNPIYKNISTIIEIE